MDQRCLSIPRCNQLNRTRDTHSLLAPSAPSSCTLFRQTDRIICHTGNNTCLGKFCALALVPRSRALGRLVAYGAQHRLTEGIRKSRAPIQVARPWHPVQYISAQSSFTLASTEHSRTIKTCKPPTNQPTNQPLFRQQAITMTAP